MDDTLLPITYRPIVLFTIGLWGWALDLYILTQCNIDVGSILQIPSEKAKTIYTPVIYFSGILSLVLSCWFMLNKTYFLSPAAAMIPYLLAFLLLFWPGDNLYRKDRLRFVRMIKRTLFSGIFSPVYFCDILFADMLTSVSNVFGDGLIVSCVLLTGQPANYFMENTENMYHKDILVPLIISVPYLIRLRQCISDYFDSRDTRHLYNALKYTTSIPVIIFSAVQKKATMYKLEEGQVPDSWYFTDVHIFRFWVICVFVNSMYSFWWDISMDWNLISIDSQTTVKIRRQLYFSPALYYLLAACLDFLLRITWSFKLSSHLLIRQLDSSIFLLELMEIFRRWVWVMFRMENEWVKKVYSTLPHTLRLDRLDRKSPSGLLSPIVEEEDPASSAL